MLGDGLNVLDWLEGGDEWVALELVVERGRPGETYNIGGGREVPNIELVGMLCDEINSRFATNKNLVSRFPDCPAAKHSRCRELMSFVKDRPGHDRRYAVCSDKFCQELGILKQTPLNEGLVRTVDWYIANENWWRSVETGSYRDWIKLQYGAAT